MADFSESGMERVMSRFENAARRLHDRILGIITDEVEQVSDLASARMAELFRNPGKMQNALSTAVEDAGAVITGTVKASGLLYLRIHEYGGQTSAHDIFPANAKVLHWMSPTAAVFRTGSTAATSDVFAKAAHHPGSLMPERSYLRYALQQRRSTIRDAFHQAAIQAFD